MRRSPSALIFSISSRWKEAEVITPPLEQAPPSGVTVEAPPQEQGRAAEAYFTHQEENRVVAGLMGMWTGTLLLHDLAVEHFEERDDIDEERERKKKQ